MVFSRADAWEDTFGKDISITQQTVDEAVCYWYIFAGHGCALLPLVFADDAVWYWFASPFFAGYHLSRLHRKKCTKELLVVFCWLLVTSTDSGQLEEPCGSELQLLIPEQSLQVDPGTAVV